MGKKLVNISAMDHCGGILHFRNTQIGMYGMPKLQKHFFEMEFSDLKEFEVYTVLKNYSWVCRQD